jgi:hypothetical protein
MFFKRPSIVQIYFSMNHERTQTKFNLCSQVNLNAQSLRCDKYNLIMYFNHRKSRKAIRVFVA